MGQPLTGNLLLQSTEKVGGFEMRRIVDILISFTILVLNTPIILFLIIAIKLDSPGPVLVRERRIGQRRKGGNPTSPRDLEIFSLYHFRIVASDFDRTPKRMVEHDRITRVGVFLQKTSLELLPEFINVLKGDMTIVGPRPITVGGLERDFDPAYAERFNVRPGVTGLWQVTRGYLGTLKEMFEVDLRYIHNRSLKLDVQIVLLTFKAIVARSNIQHWLSTPMENIQESSLYNLLKRLFDITVSLIMLIVFSPILLVLALLIRLDSPGPIIFKQTRAGKRVFNFSSNKPILITTTFNIYKFRTMQHNPAGNEAAHKQWVEDWVAGKLNTSDDVQQVVKPKSDPRVTRIGRILRATSLDELPQLVNVLRGDMSLVGPRPVPLYETEAYKTEQLMRLDALPGITGWWQVNLRGRGTLDQMVELDVEYIQKRSLWMDIKILFLTVPAVLTGRGAK